MALVGNPVPLHACLSAAFWEVGQIKDTLTIGSEWWGGYN